MIQINLLPKEYRKKSQLFSFKKGTAYALVGVGAIVLLMILGTVYQSWKIKSLNAKMAEARQRTEQLKKDIQLVDALTEVREKLLQRMSAIENLDKYRTVWIKIMEDLSARIPAYLWLSTFKEEPQVTAATNQANKTIAIPTSNPVNPAQTATAAVDTTKPKELSYGPRKATLEGYCYSINALAAFLINLNRSDYFKNVELKYIRSTQQQKHKFFTFQLGCDLIYHIEPPSFAQVEQKSGPAIESQPSAADETLPTTAEPASPEQKEPGQTSLGPKNDEQTLAKNVIENKEQSKQVP